MTADGLVTANIAAASAHDSAGNGNIAATQFARTVERVAPTVTMSSPTGNPTGATTIPVTVSFSESVSGFTSADIAVCGATASAFAGSGTTYTFNLIPTGEGTATADIAAGAATDAAGNGNTAASTFSRTIDRTGPSITLTAPANGSTTGDQTPTLSGVAGLAANDTATVTVRIYTGSVVTATPIQTLTATRDAGTGAYGVDAATLAYGTYTARATQLNSVGNVGNSAPSTFIVRDLTPPAAPTGLSVVERLSTGLRLDWSDNTEPDRAGYDVYRSSSAAGPFTKLNPALLTTSAFLDTTAQPGAIAYYEVRALDTNTNASAPATTNATRPQIAWRSTSTGQNGTATTLQLARPVGVTSGDFLIAAIAVQGNQAITAPSGWTQIQNDVSGSALRQVLFYRFATASEPTSYTWALGASRAAAGAMTAYRGVDTTQPIDVSNGQANASSTSITAPTVTTIVIDTLLVGAFGTATNPTVTPAAGMIEQSEILTTGKNKLAIEVADQIRAAAGSTGARVATADKAAVNIGQLVALRPNGAPAAGRHHESIDPGQRPGYGCLADPGQPDVDSVDRQRRQSTTTRSSGMPAPSPIGTATATTYSDLTAVAETTYTYRVVAVDAATNRSGDGVSNAVTTPANPPPDTTNPSIPANVQATAASPTRVNLTWTASTDNVAVDHYEIFRDAGSTAIGTATSTSYSDLTAVASTTYTYRVVAVDAATNRSGDGVSNAVTTPAAPPAVITFRSASTAAVQAASISVPRPTGIATGDVLLAAIDTLGVPTITPPTGWTLVGSEIVNGTSMKQATYVHVASGTEPAAYVWTFSATSTATAVIQAYSGVDTANPINVSGGQANASSTSIGSPSVNVTVSGAMLVAFFGIASNATITPPSGHAERGEVVAGPGNNRITSEGNDDPHPLGPSGTHSATASKAGLSIGQVVILKPAP